jgi:multidrug efflux pump subunit AcrB
MKRIIEWFIDNPIAANLLMAVILFTGLKNIPTVGKTVFPQTDQSSIEISAAYQGASPSDVEQQVIIRLEEAVSDLEGIDEMTSTAAESSGLVFIQVIKGYDSRRLFNNVKSRIDALRTLPDEVDSVQVKEVVPKRPLMSIAVHGYVEESVLKNTAQWLRDDLSLLPSVSTVNIEGVRNSEMGIEISEKSLRQYGLTFSDIAQYIRQSSLNVPAGIVRTEAGNIQVQTRGQAYSEDEFSRMVVTTTDDGAQLLLGDIAMITDGFEEVDSEDSFNGQPAAYLELFTTTPPDVLDAAKEANAAIEQLRLRLPPGLDMTVWRDRSTWFKSRMNLLLENAVGGLLLVFIVLMLFLSPALAGWVSLGIATAFVGVFILLPYTGVTINMLSMYGFLLALGIVVDDAIIVGESIYSQQRRGREGTVAAKLGAVFIYKPVLFAVMSTVIFFGGMFGLPGWMGSLAEPIAVVVIPSFTLSPSLSRVQKIKQVVTVTPIHVSGNGNHRRKVLSAIT